MIFTGKTATLLSFIIMLLFSASAVAEGGAAPAAPQMEKTRFEYALKLYDQGAYDSAVKELKDFLKDFPKGGYSDDAYYWLGMYYMTSGSFDQGLEQFKAILTLLPAGDKAPDAQYEAAGYWYNPENPKADCQKAMAEFMKLPFFYPDSPLVDKAVYYAALCQLKTGNYDKAEEGLRAFMDKYPASEFATPARYQLGLAFLLGGKTDDALAAFQSVRDAAPAGLYAKEALDSVELIMRAREKRALEPSLYGGKGSGPGMFYKPTGVCVGPEGTVFVSDSGNARVQGLALEASGLKPASRSVVMQTLEKALQPVKPTGICVGPKGTIYITDPALARVQVFQPDGRLLFTFGKRGMAPGELDSPAGIAVDEGGNIYVANKGNKRVDRFDPAGRFVKSIGNAGSEENLLKYPAGVAIDIQGNILVTDESADRVFKYDPDGKLLLAYGNTGEQFKLDEPEGVAVDAVGNVYVVNRGRRSVLMLDSGLKPIMEYPGNGGRKVFDSPEGIAVTGSGMLLVADPGQSKIIILK